MLAPVIKMLGTKPKMAISTLKAILMTIARFG